MILSRYLVVLCCVLLLSACGQSEDEPAGSLIIMNASVIETDTGIILPNQDVYVVDGIITKIQANGGKAALNFETGSVTDGTGLYLIPGLIDGHVHVGSMAGMSFAQSKKYPDLTAAYFAQQPKSYLYYGFTSVVDLNGSEESMTQFTDGSLHPELFHCGQALIIEDGYPAVYVPRDVRQYVFPNQLYDPRKSEHTPGVSAGHNSVKKAIERVKDSGAICVKTFHEDGFFTAIWPVPSQEMLAEIRDEATRQGLKLIVHANSFESYQAVIEVGADALAHSMWNWDQFAQSDLLTPELKVVLDRMIDKKIAQMGTLQTVAGLRDVFDPDYLDRPALEKTLPSDYLAWLKSDEGDWYRQNMVKDYPPEMTENDIKNHLARILKHGQLARQYFRKQGGMVLFGSDTPAGPVATNLPGYNGYLELKQMAESDIPLAEILKTATLGNARFFGLEKSQGSIEVGKLANMLLLSDNPLQNIEAYDKIQWIIINGRQIKRADLAVQPSL